MVMPEEMLRKRRREQELQQQQMQGDSTNAFEETLRKLQERLQGNRDARSPVGMFSRGRNMYPGGNAANTGANVQGAPDSQMQPPVNVQGAPDAYFEQQQQQRQNALQQQQRQNALQQAMGQAGGPSGQDQAQNALQQAFAQKQAGNQQQQQQDLIMARKNAAAGSTTNANPAKENAAREAMREAARRRISAQR